MKPHLHREAIKAWADGERIQCRYKDGPWTDCIHIPEWQFDHEYRAKPKPDYPTTQMTGNELFEIWQKSPPGVAVARQMLDVANAALRHACDAGQVVPREEFDSALADREVRDSAIANEAAQEAARIVESMAMGLNVVMADMMSIAAEAVRGMPICAIVERAVA